MSDSSSDESNSEHKEPLFSQNPEWKDVIPIPQDDGPYPVVSIECSADFRDVYDYFRAVVNAGEKSERVLKLTERAIILNPANYNVWQYRRLVLKHLNSNLKEELCFISKLVRKNLKNYQIWNHRRVIVEWLNDATNELDFVSDILILDEKNYHAWQYRQWILSNFKLYDGELEYIDILLKNDVRNNSVWNHRHFVINNSEGFSDEVVEKEIDYVIKRIFSLPTENESAWNYLRGILLHSNDGLSTPKVWKFTHDLYDQGCRSIHLLAFIGDICLDMLEKKIGDAKRYYDEAILIYTDLATKYDVIRNKYWNFMAGDLKKKMDSFINR